MSASDIEGFLARQDFLAGLDPESLAFLAGCASRRRIERGETLFRHGEDARRFFLLVSGRIAVEVPAIEGPRLEVQSLGAGEVLGWSWLIPPYRWSFQARALDETELVELDGERVRARCEQDPAFGYEMMKRFSALMSERLEAARARMMQEWNPPGFA